MKLLLKSITRNNTKLIFKNGRELDIEYDDKLDIYTQYDPELHITCTGKHPIDITEEYSTRVYELYKMYKDADTSHMDDEDLLIKEKIKDLIITP